ncbi:hypothetical protein M426DRAFT_240554 [Hypoxylon sp. CI-4A]|nr:hypothetical protein M426DRAFT_240554 [Hypoxylon sp. CI-4A]
MVGMVENGMRHTLQGLSCYGWISTWAVEDCSFRPLSYHPVLLMSYKASFCYSDWLRSLLPTCRVSTGNWYVYYLVRSRRPERSRPSACHIYGILPSPSPFVWMFEKCIPFVRLPRAKDGKVHVAFFFFFFFFFFLTHVFIGHAYGGIWWHIVCSPRVSRTIVILSGKLLKLS